MEVYLKWQGTNTNSTLDNEKISINLKTYNSSVQDEQLRIKGTKSNVNINDGAILMVHGAP